LNNANSRATFFIPMAWVHALHFSCILSSVTAAAAADASVLRLVDEAPGEDLGLLLLQHRSRSVRPVGQVDADLTGDGIEEHEELTNTEAIAEVHDLLSQVKEAAALIDADDKGAEADEEKVVDSFYANLAGAEAMNASTVLMAGKLRSPTAEEVDAWAEEDKNLTEKLKAKRKAEAKALAADKALEQALFAEHQRKFDIAFAKGTAEKEKAEKAAKAAAEKAAASSAAAKVAQAEHKAAKTEAVKKKEAHKSAAKKASAKKKAAEEAALEKLTAEQAALEKAAQEKAAEERAAAAKEAEEKAAAERAAAEKAVEEKAAEERNALREAARRKADADRAAEEAAEKEAMEKAAADKAHLKEEAEISDLAEAAIEKAQAYAAAAARARAAKVFEKVENTKCGWMETDFSCQWDNQAFINEGSRLKSKASRESALESCAHICEDAGEDCGGFTWTEGSCYFRKDVTCGQSSEASSDCYVKRAQNRSAPELKDEDAQVDKVEKDVDKKLILFRAQDSSCDRLDAHCLVKVEETMPGQKAEEPWTTSHQQQLQDDSSGSTMRDVFFKAKDANCGWWEIDDDCAWLNLARVNDGQNVAEAKTSEEALEKCGSICDKAGDECGGFTWRDEKCNFRKNAKCGVMMLPGSDCYVKHSMLVLPRNNSDKKDEKEAYNKSVQKADDSNSTTKVTEESAEMKDDTKEADNEASQEDYKKAADEVAAEEADEQNSTEKAEEASSQTAAQGTEAKNVVEKATKLVVEQQDLAEKAQKLLEKLEADERAAQEVEQREAEEAAKQEAADKVSQDVAEKAFAAEWAVVKADMQAKQQLAAKRSKAKTAKLKTIGEKVHLQDGQVNASAVNLTEARLFFAPLMP